MITRRDSVTGRIISIPVMDRFWAKVAFGAGCWEWTGGRFSNGYGSLRVGGRRLLAHRVAWEHVFGSTSGLLVLHHCDNPPCVRPDHLFLGTHEDNTRDMDAKHRRVTGTSVGEANGSAKLTVDQVKWIRTLGTTHKVKRRKIADIFHVSLPLVEKILSGRLWRTEEAGYARSRK